MKKGASQTIVPNLSPSLFGIGTPLFHFFFFWLLLGFQIWQIIIGTPVFEEILKLNFWIGCVEPNYLCMYNANYKFFFLNFVVNCDINIWLRLIIFIDQFFGNLVFFLNIVVLFKYMYVGLAYVCSTYIFILVYVRLNLINHFVGFIPCQFACISALRNPVFRQESCKGSV